MMPPSARGYNSAVFGRGKWRGAAALILALTFSTLLAAQARADEKIATGSTPWVNLQLSSGTLDVRTWDKPEVQVTTNGRVDVRHVPSSAADARIPRQYTVWSQTVPTDRGDVTLPEESFVLPRLAGSSHDEIVARGSGDTTVMIPRGTALVTADVGTGRFALNDYKGAFLAQVDDGAVAMNRVSGTGYVQSLRGTVDATDSSFDRLRVRTATGNLTFRGCTSHQIEASSNYGSILYDNGRFQPGLAHFESVHGNVALGVRGGARIGARSGSGHIVSSFPNGAQLRGRNSAQATVRGGGPMVTAVSKNGSVYIYNGSVRAHPRVQAELSGTSGRGVTRPGPAAPAYRQYGAPARDYQAPLRQYQAPARQYYPNYQPHPQYPQPRQYQPQPQRQYQGPPRSYGGQGQRQPRESRQQASPPGSGGRNGGGGGRRGNNQPPFS